VEQCLPLSERCDGNCAVVGCPGAQTCQLGTGECVGGEPPCGECTPEYPVCDPATGMCVECMRDADCQQVEPDLICIVLEGEPGRCSAGPRRCERDADCDLAAPAEPFCVGGLCVGCAVSEQCPPNERCSDAHRCEPNPCAGVECGAWGSCDRQSGRCLPGCTVDAECPPGGRCALSRGVCYDPAGSCDRIGLLCPPGGACLLDVEAEQEVGRCGCLLPCDVGAEPGWEGCPLGVACLDTPGSDGARCDPGALCWPSLRCDPATLSCVSADE